MATEVNLDHGAADVVSRHPLTDHLHASDRSLVDNLDDTTLAALGAPDSDLAADRLLAHRLVLDQLRADRLPADGSDDATTSIRHSPLGPAWSSDLDVCGDPPSHLAALGWLSADRFLDELGSPGRDRWYVTDGGGRVVGVADFESAVSGWPEPSGDDIAAKAVRRAREQGFVGLREVLEFRWAIRSDHRLASNEITGAAARIEAALGGTMLASALAGAPVLDRVMIRDGETRRRLASVKRLAKPRVVVGLSGVDGAGKSSLTRALLHDFARVGIEPDVIWARPGMRMEWIEPLLGLLQQGRGRSSGTPTVASVAAGERVDAASRKGVVGWVWTMLVTGTFLSHVWWRQLSSSGLKIYDRHEDDAIVSLDFVYDGVDLTVPRWLIRNLLPGATATFYLSIDEATAVARKPGDTFGHHAVGTQLDHYSRRLAGRSDITVIDATRNQRELATSVFTMLVEGTA